MTTATHSGWMRKRRSASRAAWTAATELLLRPERFHRYVLRFRAGALPITLIWIVGIAAVLENQDLRLAFLAGRSGAEALQRYEWIGFWLFLVLLGGPVGGLQCLLFGWWFRMRLRFCGAREVSKRSARLVWLYSRSVLAVPAVLLLIVLTPIFENYFEAWDAGILEMTMIALLFWSVFVSYRGAVSCFPVKQAAARWWFLIIPLGFYGLTFLVGMAAVLVLTYM